MDVSYIDLSFLIPYFVVYLTLIHIDYACHQGQLIKIGWLGQYLPDCIRIYFSSIDGGC